MPLAEAETARTACARGLLRTGVDEKTGELLATSVLAERVGWAVSLVAGMAAELLAAHWKTGDVDVLASGEDAGGRKLPSNAWMALRRLGWTVVPPEGIRVNDRIVRMAQEQAGRLLRAAKWRGDLTAAVIETWPADPAKRTGREWEAVRAALSGGQYLPSTVIKSRTRQISVFVKKHDVMPADVFEVESAPRAVLTLLLSACDRQQATIERADDPRRALLRLQLPTRPDPRSYKDWTWVACPIKLPPTIPAGAVLHLPTLRPHQGCVRVDLVYTHLVPKAARSGHTVALGVDWGLNTLLSCGAARLHDDGRIASLGVGGMFRAAGIIAKQHRLRRLSEHLHAKADRYQRLIDGRAVTNVLLETKHGVLTDQIRTVSDRRSNLNDSLAASAARWTVDQAIAAGASVIYVEDLRSLESGGMGRTINTRLSQQIRGRIVDRMRYLAAETGIAVVAVPARNTSKHCPQCVTALRHRKAPDRPTVPGWKWAICPGCGWQGDRDQGAWQRIAARGLTHQARTITIDRTAGSMAIRTVVDTLEAGAVITLTAPKTSGSGGGHTPPPPPPTKPTPPPPPPPPPPNTPPPHKQKKTPK
ncbi:zinc ribbon domain-containing protein, partial [Streptomyces sp. NPDC059193]|uniref:zinc ribbon domain-containing protein n=1 Tax=Streptomyces sp. NPDC059193 TaxID=3346763 RepID=UPI003699880D